MIVRDVKMFVPAKDFSVSLAYYRDLGCILNWEHKGGMAELELGGVRFLLQNFYVKPWAENFVIHLNVDNADSWNKHVQSMVDSGRYPGIRVKSPKDEPWGERVCYAWDPSGVLLQFAQRFTA